MTTAVGGVRGPYSAAGEAFLQLLGRVPAAAYDRPGLGSWDVRALVGHTGRAFGTVAAYLQTRADTVVARTPAEYFTVVAGAFRGQDDGVRQRGVDAGRAMGEDPLAFMTQARAAAETALDRLAGEDPVVTTVVGGMRVSDYLPSRTFELTVHALDIARAVGIDFAPPAEALAVSLQLACETAGGQGLGVRALLALTGREALPAGFSVVP